MASHAKHRQVTQAEFSERSRATFGSGTYAYATTVERLSRENALEHYATTKKRPRTGLRIFLAVFLVLVLGGAAAAAAYVMKINANLTQGVNETLRNVLTDTSSDEPFYMLLLGVDKDEERMEDSSYGADDSNYRTDTIILTRVDPKNTKVTLVSIHRDTFVDLDEHGKAKINAAYSYGGAAYTVQVVEKFSGVKISHYAEIDMDGFAAVVDVLGGVDVDLPVPVVDPEYTGLNLPAGPQHLDGITAGLLGRSRHAYDSYGDGDHYRAANQRMLIGEVSKMILSSDPFTMANTITTLSGYVTTDMSVTDIVALATKFIGMDVDEDLYSGMCPTIPTYTNETWYELCDTAKWQAIMQRVNQGLPPYESDAQDDTAGVAGAAGVTTSSAEGTPNANAQASAIMSGSVSVLNASGVSGVAGSASNKLIDAGYDAAADNAEGRAHTLIVYNGTGYANALGVAETLGLDASIISENDGTWPAVADVVVVLGEDYEG